MIPRIAIALLFASLSVNAVLLWPQLDWRILPAILLGWLIVDLVSGLFHMLFEYYPCPARLELDRIYFHDRCNTREYEQLRAQLMKRAGMFYSVVYDFKVHHPRPNTLGRRDFFKLTEFTAPFWALPVSLCVNVVAFAFPVPGWLMAFMMTLIIGNAMAQYFHATLHRKNTPLPISLLRRVGLLMSPPAHQIHHDTLDRDFAFVTGWRNPLLNRIFNVLLKKGILKPESLEPPRISASTSAG